MASPNAPFNIDDELEGVTLCSNDDLEDPAECARLVVERRNEARRWLRSNLWDELTEVYRGIKCRVKPIYKKDSSGQDTDQIDKSRTNVAMPDLNIITRRNAARMTAQPYNLNYEGGDPVIADQLSALHQKQYDRSNECSEDLRVVMSGEAFGFGYAKLLWDSLEQTRVKRQALLLHGKVVYRDRSAIMDAMGASQDDIKQAVAMNGPTMSDDEVAAAVPRSSREIEVQQTLHKYDGPVVKSPFAGDVFLEPGAITLDNSDFVIEQFTESDLWLAKRLKQTYKNDDGELVRVFDIDAVKEFLDSDPVPERRPEDLRMMFDAALGKTTNHQYESRKDLRPRKRYDMLEQHMLGPDGRVWITWVAEKWQERPLGRMPYPFDLYGMYAYTEHVPLPDLITCYGDSTPRLLRYLYAMHNQIVAQNFDYVTNLLKRLVLKKADSKVSEEIIVKGNYRVLECEQIEGVLKIMDEPPLPPGAMERESGIIRMMAMAEPSLLNTDTGDAANPLAGKTATTAVLASKNADALTQFKLDSRNIYIRKLGQKKLWMNQQLALEDWTIEQKYWTDQMQENAQNLPQDGPLPPWALRQEDMDPGAREGDNWALSERFGKTVATRLDPLEVQEDYDVEPESMSYLSVDDDLRRSAAEELERAAAAAPDVFDRRKIARFHISTIRGIGDPDDYILPEPTTPPPPPLKVAMNVTAKFEDLPSDVQNNILQEVFNMPPSQELEARDTLKGVGAMSEAADHVDNLTSPAGMDSQEKQQRMDLAAVGANGGPSKKPSTKNVKTRK